MTSEKGEKSFFHDKKIKKLTVTTIDLPTYECPIRLKLALTRTYIKVLTKEM